MERNYNLPPRYIWGLYAFIALLPNLSHYYQIYFQMKKLNTSLMIISISLILWIFYFFFRALGIFNTWNIYTLLPLRVPQTESDQAFIPSNNEVQEILMIQDSGGYTVSNNRIRPNKKIRIRVDARNPYSCSSVITIPRVGVSKQLGEWENFIEFISPSFGEVEYSCSMWMYSGKFTIDPEA